jgi:tellurite resistance protein TehA-like permease
VDVFGFYFILFFMAELLLWVRRKGGAVPEGFLALVLFGTAGTLLFLEPLKGPDSVRYLPGVSLSVIATTLAILGLNECLRRIKDEAAMHLTLAFSTMAMVPAILLFHVVIGCRFMPCGN